MITEPRFIGPLILLLLLVVVPASWGASPAERLFDPQPAEDDIVLPMPDNAMMVFRKVPVPGRGFWGDPSRVIQLGDATGGVFEGLQRQQIAGSFVNDEGQWYLMIGKYELTVAQFAAVMNLQGLMDASADPEITTLPELNPRERLEWLARPLTYVSHADIQRFVERYNHWLFDPEHPERRENLPRIEGVPGFLRLPTEDEWAFAARGGIPALEAGTFNDRLPFDATRLSEHAWHLGNARHALRPVGLRVGNHLRLYDMLGNAQEMTASRFRPEFGQGKPGGVSVRGGSVSTPEAEMRSALRAEFDEYAWDPDSGQMRQRRSFNTGARLAIGSNVILGSEQQARIEREYEAYRETVRQATPVGRSLDNLVAQASGQLDDMDALLDALIADNPGLSDPLSTLKAQSEQARLQLTQAEKARARSLVQDATRNGANLSVLVSKLPALESARDNALKLVEHSTRYESRLLEVEALIDAQKRSIDEQLSAYEDKLAELGDTHPDHVADAFETLAARRMTAREGAVLELLDLHVQRYHELRRSEPDKWLEEYSTRFVGFEDG
ncbi:SUMF1/EgtB/PvdO family nonheme iron enzyme [Halomonas cerina]|uniref:Putative nucleic acid-binding Zn-ribbon protein n=1 Tax=Halomonas cerina TaxID=447424 RepID=A0A839VEN3_9GAMM|nr:putative nucleic acid-binding Zn-ribbon protein [Halomonas cerina]